MSVTIRTWNGSAVSDVAMPSGFVPRYMLPSNPVAGSTVIGLSGTTADRAAITPSLTLTGAALMAASLQQPIQPSDGLVGTSAGLLCMDTTLGVLLIFDGVNWRDGAGVAR